MSAQFMQLGPFSDQGALSGAALLEHYEAGTSTLKNIWSDAAQTTPLAQPFVSDANGVFNFFADGNYKLVIKTSSGDVLHVLDNFKIQEVSQATLSSGQPVATASTMSLGNATWAHWTGSTNVSTLSGSALFYWAIADGNFTLVHSSSLLMPDSRNRKVLQGDVLLFLNESAGIFRLSAHMQKEGGWTGRQGASVAATATLPIPTDGDFLDVSGGTTITAVAASSAGYRFRARFTGTGLNITHNATTLIAPWGRDYRTIQNEIIEFQSLGSGNYIFYSLNGPKERVGTTIEWNTNTIPAGYLEEVGGTFSSSTYPGLAAELGTTSLPDRRGRTGVGVDGTANVLTSASVGGGNADTLWGTGGAQTHTLTLSEVPSKSVTYTAVRNVAGGVCAAGGDKGEQTNSLNVGGSDGAHSNTQPWIAKRYIMRF